MTFEEFCGEFYEDLAGRIISVEQRGDVLRVGFSCLDWQDVERSRQFELTFEGVMENSLVPDSVESIELSENHVLLWEQNTERVSMFFSTAPENPFEVLGRLYETHARIFGGWRPMAEFVHADSKILLGGFGLLAKGPRPLIEQFADVVQPFVWFTIVRAFSPSGNCRVVLFDDRFVVFKGEAGVFEIESGSIRGGGALTSSSGPPGRGNCRMETGGCARRLA